MRILRRKTFSNPLDAGYMYDQKIRVEEKKIEELRKDIKVCQSELNNKRSVYEPDRLRRSIRLDRHEILIAENNIKRLKKYKREAKAKQKKAALGLAGIAALTAGSIILNKKFH